MGLGGSRGDGCGTRSAGGGGGRRDGLCPGNGPGVRGGDPDRRARRARPSVNPIVSTPTATAIAVSTPGTTSGHCLDSDRRRPLAPARRHLLDALGVRRRQIVGLETIVGEIVELPTERPARDQLPVAVGDRAIALVLPVERARRGGLAAKEREQARPPELRTLDAVTDRRPGPGARDLVERRRQIDHVSRRRHDRAGASRKLGRPVHEERDRDSAFVRPVLVASQRRVGEMGPSTPIGAVGVGCARQDVGAIAEAHRAPVRGLLRDLHDQRRQRVDPAELLAAGAVVGQEDHERVVERGGALDRVDHAPDRAIHRRHHRGVDLHPARLPLAVGCLVPRADGRIARRQHGAVRHHPQLSLAREAGGAQRVPARVEPSAVALDVLRLAPGSASAAR